MFLVLSKIRFILAHQGRFERVPFPQRWSFSPRSYRYEGTHIILHSGQSRPPGPHPHLTCFRSPLGNFLEACWLDQGTTCHLVTTENLHVAEKPATSLASLPPHLGSKGASENISTRITVYGNLKVSYTFAEDPGEAWRAA